MATYHEGELAVQEAVGQLGTARTNGSMVQDRIPPAARSFVLQQTWCAVAYRVDGAPWICMVVGPAGFAVPSDDLRMVRLAPARADAAPPFRAVHLGDEVGLLFLEFQTRRRLRVNGRVTSVGAAHWDVAVAEAYPNCPKYIQRRAPGSPSRSAEHVDGSGTSLGAVRPWIESADTFFLGSGRPGGHLDASHRGGRPGFVHVGDGRLRIPDYAGNSMFNTFGNLVLDPRAGLVFPDFARGAQLQLTGQVELYLDDAEAPVETGGSGRWWEFHPEQWRTSALNAPATWSLVEPSPFNP